VVVGVVFNSFGEEIDGFFVSLGFKCLIAFIFVLYSELGVAH
jgi:hypothetical protein